jgi:hypothetical protein
MGNRSIIADPRTPPMQRPLNLKITCREGFRPFAPSVLGEAHSMSYSRKPPRVKGLEALILLSLVPLVSGFIPHRQIFFSGALVLLASVLVVPPGQDHCTDVVDLGVMFGTVNNTVILSSVFLSVPHADRSLYRLFKKNPLMLKAEKGTASVYSHRNHTYSMADLEKMW